ncbi:restriction endonuclease [Ventosimonas gracilis]|uniref:Restriction endonuclease n=1 Tax=Ventosimonas gracilis TaxID=1680762 RepID=A0A139SR19_9GAMM|nr:restriction endonuclease [Ventosimonas gracilis]KXU36954.1 restriction endonuclease [Ventosimonas gracilis]
MMQKEVFEHHLEQIADQLRSEARQAPFTTSKQFENRVREIAQEVFSGQGVEIDFTPHPQAFPDIEINEYGIEVKFTLNDEWRSIGNSILETNRIDSVLHVYLLFGKMGGVPDVRWAEYEKSVMHVRTSHVPRFEVQIGAEESLFDLMGIAYDDFRQLEMHEKMQYIRQYARKRLKKGERLWWLDEHALPIQAKLFTELEQSEKTRLRAEAILLCPQIVRSGRSRNKYDDAVLFLLTWHGVVCHQARDMFTAGSVGNPENVDHGGLYIIRMLKLMQKDIEAAALRMDDALFVEYWGASVSPENRIREWLKKADAYAGGRWLPSKELFLS